MQARNISQKTSTNKHTRSHTVLQSFNKQCRFIPPQLSGCRPSSRGTPSSRWAVPWEKSVGACRPSYQCSTSSRGATPRAQVIDILASLAFSMSAVHRKRFLGADRRLGRGQWTTSLRWRKSRHWTKGMITSPISAQCVYYMSAEPSSSNVFCTILEALRLATMLEGPSSDEWTKLCVLVMSASVSGDHYIMGGIRCFIS